MNAWMFILSMIHSFAAFYRVINQRARNEQSAKLTKTTRNIVFGFLATWVYKYLDCLAKLNELTQIHICSVIRAACRLLHIMRHNHHGVTALEPCDGLFHHGCCDGDHGYTGFIQQEHLGSNRNFSGDAQPLLLPS